MSERMDALLAAQDRLGEANAARDQAMRARDAAVRAAYEDGETYETIRAATGMSPPTIRKALHRG